MLSRQGIIKSIENGDIYIENFDKNKCNPNSYNLTLSDTLVVYSDMLDSYEIIGKHDKVLGSVKLNISSSYVIPVNTFTGVNLEPYLDCKNDSKTTTIKFGSDGIILYPGILYLGSTNERTRTKHWVPKIAGRSSLGRRGLQIYSTADFGDNGFEGTWTLQLSVLHPLKVYPNMEICQIYYEPLDEYDRDIADDSDFYHGKYQGQIIPTASKIYLDRSLKDNED